MAPKLATAIRCLVKLEYSESIVDMITRRKAHISFLEEDSFIKYLIVKFQSIFLHSE